MLHKNYDCKDSAAEKVGSGREVVEAWRHEPMGGKPPVVKELHLCL
jgi:hypothetical protein